MLHALRAFTCASLVAYGFAIAKATETWRLVGYTLLAIFVSAIHVRFIGRNERIERESGHFAGRLAGRIDLLAEQRTAGIEDAYAVSQLRGGFQALTPVDPDDDGEAA